MNRVQTIAVTADEADLRLDRWFKRRFPDLTHGRLERLLRTGQIRVDGRRVPASVRLAPGQQVRIPPLGDAPPRPRPEGLAREIRPDEVHALQEAVLYRD